MCSSTTVVATYTIILSLSALIILPQSYGITQDVLATICSQTQNQESCKNALQTDPRTPSADLPLLSIISIDLSIKQADTSYKTFLNFHDNSTDPALKMSFGNCTKIYENIQENLEAAYKFSQMKQYKNITQLGQLITLAYSCENGLPSNSPTSAVTEEMLLTSQTAISVNQYVSDHFV